MLSVTIPANRNDTTLTNVMSLDISNRITLDAHTKTGLMSADKDFFIESESHFVNNNKIHTVVYDLSPVSSIGKFWVMGVSLLEDEIKKIIDEEEILFWECEFCGKEFDTEKGCLYHENVHCTKRRGKNEYRNYYKQSQMLQEELYDSSDSDFFPKTGVETKKQICTFINLQKVMCIL